MRNRLNLAKSLRVLLASFAAVLVWALFPYTRESALHIKIFVYQWSAFVCLAILLLGSWFNRERLRVPQRFSVIIAAFVLLQFVAVAVSVNKEYSFFELTKWAALLILFVAASYAYQTPAQVWLLLTVFCVAMAISSIYGYAQFIGIDPISWAQKSPITRQGPSTFGNPNLAAHALVPAIVFSAGLIARKRARWPAVLLIMFLAHLAIARTRAAVLGLSLVLVFAAAYMATRKMRRPEWAVFATFAAVGAVAVAGVAAIFGLTYMRTGSPYPFDSSLVWRYHSFYGACRMIADKPLLGRGPGGYLVENPAYRTDLEKERFATLHKLNDHVHNEPLEFGVDAGLAAGMLYVVLLVLGAAGTLRLALDSQDRDRRILGLSLSAFFVGYAADGLFGFNAHVPVSGAMLFLMLGAISGVSRDHGTSTDNTTRPHMGWRVAVLGAACMIPLMGTRAFLSQCYQQRGHGAIEWRSLDAAAANFERAAALTPYDWYLHYYAGTTNMMRGKPEEAAPHFAECLALDPDYVPGLLGMAQAKFNLAVQSTHLGKKGELLDEAAQYVNRASDLCPELRETHDLLGRVATVRAWQLSQASSRGADEEEAASAWQTAETHLLRAIESGAEEKGKLYELLAQARTGLGDVDGAEQAYVAGLQTAPDDQQTWALFDRFAQTNGRYQSFLDMVNWRLRQLAKEPTQDTAAWAAASLWKAAVLERGYADQWGVVNAYRDAALAQPLRRDIWPAFCQSAKSPREKELFQSTLLTAYDALVASGGSVPTDLRAAATGLRGGAEAVKDVAALLFDALQKQEAEGTMASAHKELAWVVDLMREKLLGPALTKTQRAGVLFDLGRCLCAMGEYQRGEALLNEAQPELERKEQLLCARLRAQALLELNEAPKAVLLVRRAMTGAPDDVMLRHVLAQALARSGKLDAARFEYQVILGSPLLSQEGREMIEEEYQALSNPANQRVER